MSGSLRYRSGTGGVFGAGLLAIGALAYLTWSVCVAPASPRINTHSELGLRLGMRSDYEMSVANPHWLKHLDLHARTSCGCATIGTPHLTIQPQKSERLTVHMLATEPQQALRVSIFLDDAHGRSWTFELHPTVAAPFEGWPDHAVGERHEGTLQIPFDPLYSGLLSKTECFAGDLALPTEVDDAKSCLVVALPDEAQLLALELVVSIGLDEPCRWARPIVVRNFSLKGQM